MALLLVFRAWKIAVCISLLAVFLCLGVSCVSSEGVEEGSDPGAGAVRADHGQDADPRARREKPDATNESGREAPRPPARDVPHFEEDSDRWRLLDKYPMPVPYEINKGKSPWDPYNLNTLKGDYPVIGDDIFLSIEGKSFSVFEGRNVPTPTGTTGPGAVSPDFFGDGDQSFILSNLAVTLDLFQGQQFLKPVDWRLKITGVLNVTRLDVEELMVVNVDPARGTERTTGDLALEQALLEIHLMDLSDRYDFLSSEVGIFPFRSDFRGFIFEDINLGARIFGNADDNKWQYNLAWFNMLEKDTNSELNMLEERGQHVLIANVFREDWPTKGWVQSLSFHWNHDEAKTHFDRNDFLVRPAPVGLAKPHRIDAYYIGYAGDGHIDRLNFTYAFYQVLGKDTNNPFAARPVNIDAQFAAIELSHDWDWFRVKLYGMYASGDNDPRDDVATGFDAIVDNPNFAGGQFSFFNRATIPLRGVRLTNRFSGLPDLTTSRFEGQANFVNPGLMLIGVGADVELAPKARATLGANYMRFEDTRTLEEFLFLESIPRDLGFEVYLGVQYRPLLTNNVLLALGGSVFLPGEGFEKMYESDDALWHVFLEVTLVY